MNGGAQKASYEEYLDWWDPQDLPYDAVEFPAPFPGTYETQEGAIAGIGAINPGGFFGFATQAEAIAAAKAARSLNGGDLLTKFRPVLILLGVGFGLAGLWKLARG